MVYKYENFPHFSSKRIDSTKTISNKRYPHVNFLPLLVLLQGIKYCWPKFDKYYMHKFLVGHFEVIYYYEKQKALLVLIVYKWQRFFSQTTEFVK